MIVDALRLTRTAAYWIAGPIDRMWLRVSGRDDLPPLWLRRHTGAVAHFESAARETAEFLDRLDLLRASDLVLDIGCGAGAIVPELARRLGPAGRYVGFDVHAPSIRWCRERYAADARLSFELAAIASAYGSASGSPTSSYRFPVEDGAADLVLAKSVFTHLLEGDTRHYLSQIRRVLRPGRAAVATAFLFDPDGPASELVRRGFAHEEAPGRARLRSRVRPTAAVAYPKALFIEIVETAGLHLQWMAAGFFPGANRPTGQDTLLLGH